MIDYAITIMGTKPGTKKSDITSPRTFRPTTSWLSTSAGSQARTSRTSDRMPASSSFPPAPLRPKRPRKSRTRKPSKGWSKKPPSNSPHKGENLRKLEKRDAFIPHGRGVFYLFQHLKTRKALIPHRKHRDFQTKDCRRFLFLSRIREFEKL